MTRRLTVALVALAFAACAKTADQEQETSTKESGDDEAAIAQIRDGWGTAWKAADATTLSSYYAADAVNMQNHQPSANGAAEIKSADEAAFAEMAPNDITITSEKLDITGDVAYDRGTYSLSVTPKAGGAAMTETGRYLVVLKRQSDGSWKIVEHMANSATPLPAPAAPAKAQ